MFGLLMAHKDQKYIDALVNGDEELIKEIYKKWALPCLKHIKKNNGNKEDAEDVFQDALVAIVLKAKLSNFVLTVPFGAYLYRVYYNKWIDKLRERSKKQLTNVETERYIDIDMEMESKQLQYRIYKNCFDKLGKACKELLGARLIGKSGNQIAEELGLTRNNVNQKMLVCREQLRKCCEGHPDFKNLQT